MKFKIMFLFFGLVTLDSLVSFKLIQMQETYKSKEKNINS